MCSNYLTVRTLEELARACNATMALGAEFTPHVFPWYLAPVMVKDGEQRVMKLMRYGMVPPWDKGQEKPKVPMYNARSETASMKREFASSFRERRLLVPMDSFYEWVKREGEKKTVRVRIEPKNGSPLMAAGIWHVWTSPKGESFEAYSILTGPPPKEIAEAGHDRCPVFLKEEVWDEWLQEVEKDPKDVYRLLEAVEPVEWKVVDDPTTPKTTAPATKAGMVSPRSKRPSSSKAKPKAEQGSFLEDGE